MSRWRKQLDAILESKRPPPLAQLDSGAEKKEKKRPWRLTEEESAGLVFWAIPAEESGRKYPLSCVEGSIKEECAEWA